MQGNYTIGTYLDGQQALIQYNLYESYDTEENQKKVRPKENIMSSKRVLTWKTFQIRNRRTLQKNIRIVTNYYYCSIRVGNAAKTMLLQYQSIGVDDKLSSNKLSVSFPSLDIKITISGKAVITKSSVIYTINFNSGKVTKTIDHFKAYRPLEFKRFILQH